MKAAHDPNFGGLSLQLNLGESVILLIDGREIRLVVYETKRTSVRITFKADQDVKIIRPDRKRKDLNS